MTATARDGRLLRAIGVQAVAGLACIALGVWGLADPPPGWMPVGVQVAPVGAVVAGLVLVGGAVRQLVRRVRGGREPEGRHAR